MFKSWNPRSLQRRRAGRRPLQLETLERRLPLADLDDSLVEAVSLGAINTTPKSVTATISPDDDVDMYAFTASAGQVIDFDIDTAQNGPGGLGSFIRLFNASGVQLTSNNDAAAPGENTVGFDSYLRFTINTAGSYYIGVSNANNTGYNAVTGNGDTTGGVNAVGSYQLFVQALPVDSDDTLGEATILGSVTTTPKTANDSIVTDIDVDVYRFAVTAGEVVDIDIDTPLNGPGGLGSFIRVFNSTGQQLASNNDAAAPGENVVGFDSYLRFTFATAGNYFVAVSNNNNTTYSPNTGLGDTAGGQNSIGDYQIIVQTAPAVPVDNDDEISEAISLGSINTNPNTVSGSITPDVDVDMYRFTVAANQTIDFDIDTPLNGPGGLGTFIRLFNAQGLQLASNDDGIAPGENTLGFDSYLRFTFATAGTFFLGVSNLNNRQYNPLTGDGDTSGGGSATGNYQLTAQALPVDTDDELTEANALGTLTTTPTTVNADITPDIDVDLYRFTASAGQIIDFDIDTVANGPGGLGSFLRLFNAAGQEIAFNDDAAAPGESVIGFDSYVRFTFATAGTYYVGVSNNTNRLYVATTGNGDTAGGPNSIGAYQLNVQLVTAAPPDPDDTLTEAVLLGAITTAPVTRNDSISLDTDVDLYSFAATAGQVIDFDIDTTLNGPGGLGSFLRLFNSVGQQIDFNDDDNAPGENVIGFDAYLRFRVVTAGTYYIGVSNLTNNQYNSVTGAGDVGGGPNATGAYQLIVQALPDDPDDTQAQATTLGSVTTTPITRNASINPDIDVDLYAITVTGGQIVDIDIDTTQNGPGGLGSFLRLFNSLGQQLATNNDAAAPGEGTIGFDAYLRFTFATAGTFYIGVSNSNNVVYDPVFGTFDTDGGFNSIGDYQLIVRQVVTPPTDPDDTLTEAPSLGAISTSAVTRNDSIAFDTDVDLYRFTVTAGQVVDFDLDTSQNGPGGVNGFFTLFNAQGATLATSNNAAAPGENTVGFDPYLRFTFATAGTFYLGVSNAGNTLYDPIGGDGDIAGSADATGSYTLTVQALPIDLDDSLTEAVSLGAISTTASVSSGSITPDIDVDLYQFTVTAGQIVDFDIDTTQNGPGGLGSFLRLFNASGQMLAFNNDDAAPGEVGVGFDAYLRFAFAAGGTYYIGVSNANNFQYDPLTGDGDATGGQNSVGAYQLIVNAVTIAAPALSLAINPASIPETGGTATGTVTRTGGIQTQPLVINLASSSPANATVPATVTIPANQSSATFTISAVQNPSAGTTTVTVTATATGFTTATRTLQVVDSSHPWQNPVLATDVNNDGLTSPLDALIIFNFINVFGPGPVPSGSPPPFFDTSGDDQITPLDALLVFNALNAPGGSPEGEGEAAPAMARASSVPQPTAPVRAATREVSLRARLATLQPSSVNLPAAVDPFFTALGQIAEFAERNRIGARRT